MRKLIVILNTMLRAINLSHERLAGRRAAHRAEHDAKNRAVKAEAAEAGAQSASLEPGRAPGYPDHHSLPRAARHGRIANLDSRDYESSLAVEEETPTSWVKRRMSVGFGGLGRQPQG